MSSRRVIVHVSGGVAEVVSDPGVDVLVLDWDCMGDGNGLPSAAEVRVWQRQYDGLLEPRDIEQLQIMAEDNPMEEKR